VVEPSVVEVAVLALLVQMAQWDMQVMAVRVFALLLLDSKFCTLAEAAVQARLQRHKRHLILLELGMLGVVMEPELILLGVLVNQTQEEAQGRVVVVHLQQALLAALGS
jgi:hypothetical protein